MFLPLSSGSTSDWESKKSLPQPSVGQIATAAFGVPQNLLNTALCGASRKFILIPIFDISLWNSSAVVEAGGSLSAITSSGGPLYRPLLKPAFFRYCCASGMLAVGLL